MHSHSTRPTCDKMLYSNPGSPADPGRRCGADAVVTVQNALWPAEQPPSPRCELHAGRGQFDLLEMPDLLVIRPILDP